MESLRTGRIFDEEIEYYEKDWHNYYPTIIHLVPQNSCLLDIGCGRGGLLEHLRDRLNCRVMGLDISNDAIRICQEKGIDAIRCDLEEENIPGKYDVIVLSAILEHLIDPVSLLNKLKDNPRRGGSIIVGVPNFSHIMARIQYLIGRNIQRFDPTAKGIRLGVQPLGYVQFFNKATLQYLLERTGYEPIEWSYHKSRGMCGLYRINHALFSSFIAARAKRRLKLIKG